MIISVEDLKNQLPDLKDQDDQILKKKLDAMETLVRNYTNNNFQNRKIRFTAESNESVLNGMSPFLKIGDTVQISQSGVNDGLYVVEGIGENLTVVDRDLFPVDHNLVTKVEYPFDVVIGVINLMKWETENRDKVGIKSETLSRHSVTYFDLDANNQSMGYPVSLLGFLELYKRARF